MIFDKFHPGYRSEYAASRPYHEEDISAARCGDSGPGGPLETYVYAVLGQPGGPLWINRNESWHQYGVLNGTNNIDGRFASGTNSINAVAKVRNKCP